MGNFSRALITVILNPKHDIVLEENGKTFAVWCTARAVLAVDVVPALIVEYAGGNGLADQIDHFDFTHPGADLADVLG